MKLTNQTNRILGNDWLHYHPYTDATFVDDYYISLCNRVLKIIKQSEIAVFLKNKKLEKSLACVLGAYFEDVISETHLFSTFTRLHKKMYGKELPFYETSYDYYTDEVNLTDIYFLIWYHISSSKKDVIIDPFFENNQAFDDAILEIYDLFYSEFEKAPQNEILQNFLQLSADNDVKTIREKLSFIACESFLWKDFFAEYFEEVIDEYKKNGGVVTNGEDNMYVYDQMIYFIFNEYMPLLTLRANEYFAELLGEEHSEYQFIKNISKLISGSFLIRKIKEDSFLIEHLSSKKRLVLSNEFTFFKDAKLIENDTVLSICLVNWKDNVWQNQCSCVVNSINNLTEEHFLEHDFDDEDQKKEYIEVFEKVFLETTNGQRIFYLRGRREYIEFSLKATLKHAEIENSKMTEKELNERYRNYVENNEKKLPFKKNEALGIFFNSNNGIEVVRDNVIFCMPDKNNPYYANKEFDVCDLINNTLLSKEFIFYATENKIIKLGITGYKNPDMFNIVMKNLDFLLRFYRRSSYFTEFKVNIV